jgi:hypothetical protein
MGTQDMEAADMEAVDMVAAHLVAADMVEADMWVSADMVVHIMIHILPDIVVSADMAVGQAQ